MRRLVTVLLSLGTLVPLATGASHPMRATAASLTRRLFVAQSPRTVARTAPSSSRLQILRTSPLRILKAPPPALDALAFANTTTGWAGGTGVLLGTRDGGRTWVREWTGQGTVTEILPVTPSVAYAVTDRALLGTKDGGRSWRTLQEPGGVPDCTLAPESPCIVDAVFPSADVGYAVATLPAFLGTNPGWVALSPSGRLLFTSNSNTVTAFDLAKGRIVWFARVGQAPAGIAVGPNGRRLFVADQGDATVAVVDTAAHKVIATVRVAPEPCAVAVSPDGRRAYVAGFGSPGVTVIDTRTDRAVATIPVDGSCGLALSPSGDRLSLVGESSHQLWVIDTARGRVTTSFPAGESPWGVVVSPDGRLLYVTDALGNRVLVLDARSGRIVATYATPELPYGLALDASHRRLYVVASGSLVALDLVTGKALATVPVGQALGDVVLSPGGSAVYTANEAQVVNVQPPGFKASLLATSGLQVTNTFGMPVPLAGGVLYRTSDGGATWSRLHVPAPVQSVCFLDGERGFAADGSRIYTTRDSGRTWALAYTEPIQAVPDPFTAVLCRGGSIVAETSAQEGALGHEPYIAFVSTDGGLHFHPSVEELYTHMGDPGVDAPEGPGSYPGPLTLTSAGQPVFAGTIPAANVGAVGTPTAHGIATHTVPGVGALAALSFPTTEAGWVLTGGLFAYGLEPGRILRTQDGGKTWVQVFPAEPSPVYGLAFVSPRVGFGLGMPGDAEAVLRTDDGGKTWAKVGDIPTSTALFPAAGRIAFVDSTRGYVVSGSGELLETTNGGKTWQRADLAAKGSDAWVAFSGPLGCTLVGSRLYVTRDGGQRWTISSASPSTPSPAACVATLVAPTWAKVATALAANDGDLVAVLGAKIAWARLPAALLRTADGGRTWTEYTYPASFADAPPVAFASPSPTTGYLFTGTGQVYRTEDGGAAWAATP